MVFKTNGRVITAKIGEVMEKQCKNCKHYVPYYSIDDMNCKRLYNNVQVIYADDAWFSPEEDFYCKYWETKE